MALLGMMKMQCNRSWALLKIGRYTQHYLLRPVGRGTIMQQSVAAGLSNRPVAHSHIAVGAMGLPPLHVVCGGAGQLWIPRT